MTGFVKKTPELGQIVNAFPCLFGYSETGKKGFNENTGAHVHHVILFEILGIVRVLTGRSRNEKQLSLIALPSNMVNPLVSVNFNSYLMGNLIFILYIIVVSIYMAAV